MRNPILKRPIPTFSLSTITLALLTACGGGGGGGAPTPEPLAKVDISGVVADGPLQGATVCYDLNDNGACDSSDPTSAATTDANGAYAFSVLASDAGKHAVLAVVPATAIDKDTGQAIGAAMTLRSPPSGTGTAQAVFVSALTTLVADLVKDEGKSLGDAAAQVQSALALSVSPLANFVGQTSHAEAAVTARAVTAVMVEATRLATASGVAADKTAALVKQMAAASLDSVAQTLGSNPQGSAQERAALALAATKAALNLNADTALALAHLASSASVQADADGPNISVRRFSFTDASSYSFTLFLSDSSQRDANGEFVAHEVRKSVSSFSDVPFNRNQMYWTGSEWKVCALQWEVITRIKNQTGTAPQSSTYCNASKSESKVSYEDIGGQSMRDVITRMRAFPLADSVGAHTNAQGLPVNWGPAPKLLAPAHVFPAGAKRSWRSVRADIGGTDRMELTTKSTVRWPDGKYRQATSLEQYGLMPGNLIEGSAVVGTRNTVYVADLPMASQPDSSLESFKRWRAGLDVAGLKIRFYHCDVRKSDQAQINCETQGDGTLAISMQGDARLLRVASGYPAGLRAHLNWERFWAEHSGTVLRGVRDLPVTRHDQRLNATAWNALRTALGIEAPVAPTAPAAAGPFQVLRTFTFTDANNYAWRMLTGDSSQLDTAGRFNANEERMTVSGGAAQPHIRGAVYWTGNEWYACPDDGAGVIVSNAVAPFESVYCKGYLDSRKSSVTLTLSGRNMADVVNDIRAYGSKDGTFDYGNWGPNPAVHTALANASFPQGATLEYRGQTRTGTPLTIGTQDGNKVRVPPANVSAPFNTWPIATTLDELIAKYPGDFNGGAVNGATTFHLHSYTLAAAPSPEYTTTMYYRVAFDASTQKARFWLTNVSASTGFSTNFVPLMDTPYSVETVGGNRMLKFAAMPAGFESQFFFTRLYAERAGTVWYAWKDYVPEQTMWTIRLNGIAAEALGQQLGIR